MKMTARCGTTLAALQYTLCSLLFTCVSHCSLCGNGVLFCREVSCRPGTPIANQLGVGHCVLCFVFCVLPRNGVKLLTLGGGVF